MLWLLCARFSGHGTLTMMLHVGFMTIVSTVIMGFYDFNDAIAANFFNVFATSQRCELYMLIAQAHVIAMVIRGRINSFQRA